MRGLTEERFCGCGEEARRETGAKHCGIGCCCRGGGWMQAMDCRMIGGDDGFDDDHPEMAGRPIKSDWPVQMWAVDTLGGHIFSSHKTTSL